MTSKDSNTSPKGNQVRIAGAVAGVGSGWTKVAVGHGFDTIKTRLQVAPKGTYKGAIDCFWKTVRNESPLALYKGALPPAVAWGASDSLLLGSLHNYRLFLIRNGVTETIPGSSDPGARRLTLFGHWLAGLGAGWTGTILAHPMEIARGSLPWLVKLQMQTQRDVKDRQYKGVIDVIRQIYRVQGPMGIWRGFASSLVYRSSFCWMFASYEVIMRTFTLLDGTRFEMTTPAANFLAGGLGSFGYWIMGIPFDNIKNRILAAPLDAPRLRFWAVARGIYATQGWRGYYAGLSLCIIRAFPVNACAFLVYESLMRAMGAEKVRS
ncbi:carnitine/acylcarnitine carrier protein [Rhizoctonia solani 123E]|uniref:Carnitine/acylcarnitine carrier protein n=1 Tax=Rhizoctonia solani 123E TaxID=1423351 RepID=A0A074STU8_9AGAM|nr:carnitine/acylcarnitine carrier protein [Rhizoctonia solani 123E]